MDTHEAHWQIKMAQVSEPYFRYQEEDYSYDPKKVTARHDIVLSSSMKFYEYLEDQPVGDGLLCRNGAQWSFYGTGQALSELLETMSK